MSDPINGLRSISVPTNDDLMRGPKAALAMATGITIESDVEYSLAGEELSSVKSKQKSLEERRTSITKPMNDALKAVNALFKPAAEALDQAESLIKRAMIDYTNKVAAERESLFDVVVGQDSIVVRGFPPDPPKAAGISKVREVRKAIVTDKRAFIEFAITKPELLAMVDIDEAKLTKLLTALGWSVEYPGVSSNVTQTIAARAA